MEPIDDLIEEITISIAGLNNWIERAKDGQIKRPAYLIERKQSRLEKQIGIKQVLLKVNQKINNLSKGAV